MSWYEDIAILKDSHRYLTLLHPWQLFIRLISLFLQNLTLYSRLYNDSHLKKLHKNPLLKYGCSSQAKTLFAEIYWLCLKWHTSIRGQIMHDYVLHIVFLLSQLQIYFSYLGYYFLLFRHWFVVATMGPDFIRLHIALTVSMRYGYCMLFSNLLE